MKVGQRARLLRLVEDKGNHGRLDVCDEIGIAGWAARLGSWCTRPLGRESADTDHVTFLAAGADWRAVGMRLIAGLVGGILNRPRLIA